MAKYFVMTWASPLRAERHTLEVDASANDKRWRSGRIFSVDDDDEEFWPPTEVIDIVTEKPAGKMPHVYPEYSSQPIPLMTKRLVGALLEAGVDNLQAFKTRLVDPYGTPSPPADLYLAVNIVGRVAAADLSKSILNEDVKERMISADFHSLVVKEKNTKGALMFRLAENISVVLVHEKVKEFVIANGIDTLTWLAPEEWAG